MTNSNGSGSLSRGWLHARCCRNIGNYSDMTAINKNNNRNHRENQEVALCEETETLLHRIAFTVWHTALHIEREVRYTHVRVLAPQSLLNLFIYLFLPFYLFTDFYLQLITLNRKQRFHSFISTHNFKQTINS